MNHLKTFGAALVLMFILTMPALAGHIEIGYAPPPPPPTPTNAATDADNVAGRIETPATSEDAVTDIALNIASSLLALF
jgi:hypothetical protein